MTSFATRSEDALKHFLRTAVVVDDRVSSISKCFSIKDAVERYKDGYSYCIDVRRFSR